LPGTVLQARTYKASTNLVLPSNLQWGDLELSYDGLKADCGRQEPTILHPEVSYPVPDSQTKGGSWSPSETQALVRSLQSYRRLGNHWLRYAFCKRFTEGLEVLDVGCGHGFGALVISESCQHYLGVDSDESAISWAVANCQPQINNATYIPLKALLEENPKNRFPVVLCFEVLEHVNSPKELLSWLKEISSPGGLLILSTPNGLSSMKHPSLYRSEFHVTEFSPREVRELLVAAGFEQIELHAERRIDFMDVLVLFFRRYAYLRRLKNRPSALHRSAAGQTKPWDIGPTSLARVAQSIFNQFDAHLNGPGFWRIGKARSQLPERLTYSTIVLTARKPYNDRR
jgi:2-polyprenyl-3-methyl-5-hydroxy-6-metoxy-1,4-benzoquinol methylase